MRIANSSTGPMIKLLKLKMVKMKKVIQLLLLPITEARGNNGLYFMLIKLTKIEPRDTTESMVSISIDLSISDQDCLSKELLSAMVPTTFG